MEDVDTDVAGDEHLDEDELLLKHVIQGDHQLLYLHSYLEDTFANRSEADA